MMIVVMVMLHVSIDLARIYALVIMDIEEMDKFVQVRLCNVHYFVIFWRFFSS